MDSWAQACCWVILAKKRREKIFLGLPDALDLMVVCVEAGLGMDQALRKVADEMGKCHREIGEEFGIANKQLQFGQTRNEVLHALGPTKWRGRSEATCFDSDPSRQIRLQRGHRACESKVTRCEPNVVRWPKKKQRRRR